MKKIGIKYELSESNTFFLNLISIILLMILFLQIMPSAGLAEDLIGIVDVPRQRHISAAIYNSNGERIKELLAYESTGSNTQIELRWDGKDENGKPVPLDKPYQWRALITEAGFHEEGAVGNTGNPWREGIIHNGNVDDIVFDSQGNCYTVSYWEEAHNEIRKLDSNWNVLWQQSLIGPHRVAVDDSRLYVAALVDGEDRIYIYDTDTGEGGVYFLVNKSSQGLKGVNAALRGLDVDSKWLWIADYYNDCVCIYDKFTNQPVGRLDIPRPQGVAVESTKPDDPHGFVWISHGKQVSRYQISSTGQKFTRVAVIDNLSDPAALEIGGPDHHLFLVEKAKNRILEYDISLIPTPAGKFHEFGRGFTRGRLLDDEFVLLNDVAVAPDGRVAVSDAGNFRIQLFDAQGKLIHSEHIAWQPAPFVDKITSSVHRLLTFGYEYEIDLSGAVHPEWMAGGGDGTWRLVANWWDRPWATMLYWRRVSLHVPEMGVQVYIICMQRENGSLGGFVIYHVSPDGTTSRRSAIVALSWLGEKGDLPRAVGRFVWTDKDGDEQVEEAEVTWKDPKGKGRAYTLWCPSMTVDDQGNLYYARGEAEDLQGQALKIPLLGFDKLGNPLYDWNKAVIMVNQDSDDD
ncbi:MAG: hypothetical protein JW801_06590, partial [Bacteroidales bacterium]|nr:hypothetical protein [Bacteroidales bacterium]